MYVIFWPMTALNFNPKIGCNRSAPFYILPRDKYFNMRSRREKRHDLSSPIGRSLHEAPRTIISTSRTPRSAGYKIAHSGYFMILRVHQSRCRNFGNFARRECVREKKMIPLQMSPSLCEIYKTVFLTRNWNTYFWWCQRNICVPRFLQRFFIYDLFCEKKISPAAIFMHC